MEESAENELVAGGSSPPANLGSGGASRRSPLGWKRVVAAGVSAAVVALAFAYVLPTIAQYGRVWVVVDRLSWAWIAALIAVTAVNVVSNAPPWLAALPGLPFLSGLQAALASSALSLVVPGGTAVAMATQFLMLRRQGFRRPAVAVAVTLTNAVGQLITYGFPVIGVAALAASGVRNRTLDWVALVGLGLFSLIVVLFTAGLSSSRVACAVGDWAAHAANRVKRLFGRAPVRWGGDELASFRVESMAILRRRWHVLGLAMLASQLAVFLVLVVTLRAIGVPASRVSVAEAFAAWSLIRALGSIPITPGGFGVEELALTGALVGFGADSTHAVAATLIYRFLTVTPILALGLLATATFKLRQRTPERAPDACQPQRELANPGGRPTGH